MKNEELYIIATKLKELRESKHLSQVEISNILKVNRNTYANWEIGRTEIPIDMLNNLANLYKINIDYLFNLNQLTYITPKELNLETIAQNLKQYLKEKNLKIEAFALDANTTISTIWAYLHAKQKIKTTYLYRICINNHLSADYLLGKVDSPKNIL